MGTEADRGAELSSYEVARREEDGLVVVAVVAYGITTAGKVEVSSTIILTWLALFLLLPLLLSLYHTGSAATKNKQKNHKKRQTDWV